MINFELSMLLFVDGELNKELPDGVITPDNIPAHINGFPRISDGLVTYMMRANCGIIYVTAEWYTNAFIGRLAVSLSRLDSIARKKVDPSMFINGLVDAGVGCTARILNSTKPTRCIFLSGTSPHKSGFGWAIHIINSISLHTITDKMCSIYLDARRVLRADIPPVVYELLPSDYVSASNVVSCDTINILRDYPLVFELSSQVFPITNISRDFCGYKKIPLRSATYSNWNPPLMHCTHCNDQLYDKFYVFGADLPVCPLCAHGQAQSTYWKGYWSAHVVQHPRTIQDMINMIDGDPVRKDILSQLNEKIVYKKVGTIQYVLAGTKYAGFANTRDYYEHKITDPALNGRQIFCVNVIGSGDH